MKGPAATAPVTPQMPPLPPPPPALPPPPPPPATGAATTFKGMLIRRLNVIVSVVSVLCLFTHALSWTVSVEMEGGKLKRRHIGSILGFAFTTVTLIYNEVLVRGNLPCPPSLALYLPLQILAVLSLFLTAVSAGMNGIVVDLCSANDIKHISTGVHCDAHYAEYAASFVLVICMGVIVGLTQQRVVDLVDRGVLQGIGSRMSRL